MSTSVFNQLFNMKKGTRSANYDAENQIPVIWEGDFQKLHDELISRNELSGKVMLLYQKSESSVKDVLLFLNDAIATFKNIAALRFSEPVESVIAHESMMLVYGYKICINIYPYIKTKEDADVFFGLYKELNKDFIGLNETLKYKFDFWHQYAFKIGLHSLNLSIKIRKECIDFFKVSDDFDIFIKNENGNFDGTGNTSVQMIAQYISERGERLDTSYGNLPYVLVSEKIKEIANQ